MWPFLLFLGCVSVWVLSSSSLFSLTLLCLCFFLLVLFFLFDFAIMYPHVALSFPALNLIVRFQVGFLCVLQKDRVALRLSIVTIKYLAEKQSVLGMG